MPLSEQEQRLLNELERQFVKNDADVVSAKSTGRALSYRNIVLGTIGVLIGLGMIVGGITVWNSLLVVGIVLGSLGFALMIGGVLLAITPAAADPGAVARDAKDKPRASQPSGASFMDKMNDRWEKRQRGE